MSWDFFRAAIAVVVTSPLGILTYYFAFLRRLTAEERDLISRGRSTASFRSRRVALFLGAAFIVIGTASSAPSAPLWVFVVGWAITYPCLALAYAQWSLGLRRSDYSQWVDSAVHHQRVPAAGGFVIRFFIALLPGVLVFVALSQPAAR